MDGVYIGTYNYNKGREYKKSICKKGVVDIGLIFVNGYFVLFCMKCCWSFRL